MFILCVLHLDFCKRFPNVATAGPDNQISFPWFSLDLIQVTERSICLLSSLRFLHASGKVHSSHAIREDVYQEEQNMMVSYLMVYVPI